MAKIKKDTSLRKAILQAAITGQLISNVDGEAETGKQLLDRIIEERNKKLLAEWEEKLKENPKTKKPTQIVASEIDDEDIPFEIPESWCWCRLGDICNAQLGKTLDKSKNPKIRRVRKNKISSKKRRFTYLRRWRCWSCGNLGFRERNVLSKCITLCSVLFKSESKILLLYFGSI